MPAATNFKIVLAEYLKALTERNTKKIIEFYDANATFVLKDKKAAWGKKEIEAAFNEWFAVAGTFTNQNSNEKIEATENYVVANADFYTKSSTIGEIRGHIYQVWKRVGGRFIIIHEESAS